MSVNLGAAAWILDAWDLDPGVPKLALRFERQFGDGSLDPGRLGQQDCRSDVSVNLKATAWILDPGIPKLTLRCERQFGSDSLDP